ncbi:hypothetical protein VRC02_15680 [Erwinia sp. E_sp_B01_3]|uniref:hypothetical protein n=1 Tax=unclassified Erwinia TaxID=2622719 RepID=UPI0030CCE2E9
MKIKVIRYISGSGRTTQSYLIAAKKRNGNEREYIVQFDPVHPAMYSVLKSGWTQNYVENFAWMVSFYPFNALLSLNQSGRFSPDSSMRYTRIELEQLMVEGVGEAIHDLMFRHDTVLLIAAAIRENLGKLYHRVLIRHAEAAGYHYHQAYRQEALYVLEKKEDPSTQKPSSGKLSRDQVIALSLACMNQQADAFAEQVREKGGWPGFPPQNRATRS